MWCRQRGTVEAPRFDSGPLVRSRMWCGWRRVEQSAFVEPNLSPAPLGAADRFRDVRAPIGHSGEVSNGHLASAFGLRQVDYGTGPFSQGLLREPEEALGALAPIPERRVASSAFCRGEVGIEDRTLLVPLRPLGERHLTNH